MESRLNPLLEELTRPSATATERTFAARPIPGRDPHLLGLDAYGLPCVLIFSIDVASRAPLELSGLQVRYCVPCTLRLPDGTETEELLTVVSCRSADITARAYFLYLMDTVLGIVGSRPSVQVIVDAISHLADIFQQISRPPRRTMTGLYGELLCIAVSDNPIIAVSAWRSELDDRFDFSIDDARLETKATSKRVRAHSFSLEQCTPIPSTTIAVASLFVENSGGGQSIAEILTEIEALLGADDASRMKLHRVVASSLGSTLGAALGTRFDRHLAHSSLRIFDVASIPAVRDGIPAEVSQVRFLSNLSSVKEADLEELAEASASLRRLMPK